MKSTGTDTLTIVGGEVDHDVDADVLFGRGERLERRDHHPEFDSAPSQEPFLRQRTLEQHVRDLRVRRHEWALSIAIVNPASDGSGLFLRRLMPHLAEYDRCTVVSTMNQPFNGLVQQELAGREPSLLKDGAWFFSWLRSDDRIALTHESFDIVFAAAEGDDDRAAAEALTEYASLIIVNAAGKAFYQALKSETDPSRPSFTFDPDTDHLKPLLSDGTDAYVKQYIESLSACKQSHEGICALGRCPAKLVAELLSNYWVDQDPVHEKPSKIVRRRGPRTS